MVILFWATGILILAILIGEIRFRQLKVIKNNEKIIIKKWTDSIDKDMSVLDIEASKGELIPMAKLAMRGSWRLAQDLVIDINNFRELKDYEYNKKL